MTCCMLYVSSAQLYQTADQLCLFQMSEIHPRKLLQNKSEVVVVMEHSPQKWLWNVHMLTSP